MITDYADSSLWQKRVTLSASGEGKAWLRELGYGLDHTEGVRPKCCPHKFHQYAEENVLGSARIVCLCLYDLWCCVSGEMKHFNLLSTEFINKVNWPPERDSEAEDSSVGPSSEPLRKYDTKARFKCLATAVLSWLHCGTTGARIVFRRRI